MLSPELTSVPTADVRLKVYTDIKLLIDHSWIQGPGLDAHLGSAFKGVHVCFSGLCEYLLYLGGGWG